MTLSDGPFEKTLTSIYSSELQPGAVVNEAALAERFGVSRGPVREAVRRLQGIRLVSRTAYRKASVVSLSGAEVLELFQIREALEGIACSLAAERMTGDELSSFTVDMEAARQARINLTEIQEPVPDFDFDFHERIVRGCRNSRIANALCGDLYHLLRIYRRRSGAVPERRNAVHAEHRQIFRATKTRDSELAESLMRSHISRAARHVVDRLLDSTALQQHARYPQSNGKQVQSPPTYKETAQ